MSWLQHLCWTHSRDGRSKKPGVGYGGICRQVRRGKKAEFSSLPIFPLNTKVIPQGEAQSLLSAFYLLHFLLKRDLVPTASTFSLHPSQRGTFTWKQRPDSHGPCHKDPQSGHSHAPCRQLTQIYGPALPPAPRSFLLAPVLSFPICKMGYTSRALQRFFPL